MTSPSIRNSPESETPTEAMFGGTLSVRDKSLMKRNINKHHNNNLSAGYVPVHEEDLHKTGLRGRKTYLFWTLVGLLSLLALVNLILLLVMVSVLRIGFGMESLEIIPKHPLVKFYGKTGLANIYKPDGMIEGYEDEPLTATGIVSHLAFDINAHSSESAQRVLTLEQNQTSFRNVQSLNVNDPESGRNIFSTVNPSFGISNGLKHLNVDLTTTSRVTSPTNENLVLRSDAQLRFKGNEGTRIEGKTIQWSADQFLFLKSINGSIILNGTKGVAIDMNRMPEASVTTETSQFKICVCMPSGKLFRVEVIPNRSSHSACDKVNMDMSIDPCKLA